MVAKGIIAKVSKVRAGPEYDAAVGTGTAYWLTVMAGKPDAAAKQRFDEAMSVLIGCRVAVLLKRKTRIENLKRAINDTFTSRN